MTNTAFLHVLGLAISLILLAGCATYQPEPISPEKTAARFNARSLTDETLQAFLATNHVTAPGLQGAWNLDQLTLVAFYYQPVLAEARAQWATVQASMITAGQRPNPSVGFTPTYDTTTPPPWIFTLTWDIPIETAGKRGKRMAEAGHLSEAARWDFVSAAWQVRSRVRAALLDLFAARQTEALLTQQASAQSNVVQLLEGQLAVGAVSGFEVTQARVALETTQLAVQDAVGRRRQARVRLAIELGVPVRALDGVTLSFVGLDRFPRELTQPEVRQDAILNRADVRGALAKYAASQSALQLEIAKQYPDLHLGPGYELDQTDNKWSLGVTLDLPVLNQNQGPIAEAEAKRKRAAAHFLAVQAGAIGEMDAALAGYRVALQQAETAQGLLDNLQKQLDSVHAQEQTGEVEPLAVASAEVEFGTGAQHRLDALIRAQQALGQLEDAAQSPLTLSPSALDAAERGFTLESEFPNQ